MQSIALRLVQSTRHRHLFFTALTLFTVTFMGYHFGTFDQVVHLPYLKTFADPSLYPNDPFVELRLTKYSFFWFFFQPFYQRGVLEITLFIAHLAATYLTIWMIWNLSATLFERPLTLLLTTLIFIFPHLTFGIWTIFEFSLLNRTFVLPFLLLAIDLFLRQRYGFAFAIVGLVFNLHVISANFVLAMFLFHMLWVWRDLGWKNIAQSILAFAVAASPVLVWKAMGPASDLHLRFSELATLTTAQQANNYHLFAPNFTILLATLSGFSALALFYFARRNLASNAKHQTLGHFMLAALIVLSVEVVTAEWLPIEIILELQIMRVGVFILMLSLLYLANYLAQEYAALGERNFNLNLLTAAAIFALTPAITLLVWVLRRVWETGRMRWANVALFITLNASAFVTLWSLNVWYPGIYIYPRTTPWYETQVWARDHTPKDAMFITPPHLWWFYESEWRVFSERAMVASLSDLLELALDLGHIESWKPRFEAIAPGALDKFAGNFLDNPDIAARAYYSLSDADFARVARQYRATYLVLEKPHQSAFPVVYENSQFVIYRLGDAP